MKAEFTLGHQVFGDLDHKSQDPESILWNRFIEGNTTAFHTLYSQYINDLLSYGIRLVGDVDLVKDIIQDLFIELWENRQSYNKKVEKVGPYLLTIMRRKIFKKAKESGMMLTLVDSDFERDTTSSPEHEFIDNENTFLRNNEIQKAIQKLTKRHQELIHLRYYVQLSNKEIAKITGLSYTKVTYGLRTALQVLGSVLGKKEMYFLLVYRCKSFF
ncbi:RNA polymerase sigma factor [Sinomicrobium weinanense]|uniref:Sigma-70 family RNA polymerase sigma factor n=1 Tax=Sinomicrobium weinanense TaxID=2842200 RepID=A0A926Q347_9FLAO|nr:sigma-70 family RNA polymerase sigma factor [Sinomicrobium weinanense]MBC9795370.1 sigma-70 family RNA polymerase sigma factor [Sinomicrobium weinanense]MBU3122915.1 sigma-70 family RNA polymerase sigma factor [Sinomicrobium weinanense]